jgi:hypothetical protein
MNAMNITRDGLVAALTGQPSLEEQLERARHDLVCAQMIDSTARMLAETAACRKRVAEIERQIADRDGVSA